MTVHAHTESNMPPMVPVYAENYPYYVRVPHTSPCGYGRGRRKAAPSPLPRTVTVTK